MQLTFRFSINPAKYAKRFGLDIPDDSVDEIGVGGGERPEGEADEPESEGGEASAKDEAVGMDIEYSSNAPSQACQTTLENCRAANPLTCPYHGLKLIKQDITDCLRRHGVTGDVEVINDRQTSGGRHRNDFAVVINCPDSEEQAVRDAMGEFFSMPGIRGDVRDLGYDDDEHQDVGTFEIDLLDPNASRYTGGGVAPEPMRVERPQAAPPPPPPPPPEPSPEPAPRPAPASAAAAAPASRESVTDVEAEWARRMEEVRNRFTEEMNALASEMQDRMRAAVRAANAPAAEPPASEPPAQAPEPPAEPQPSSEPPAEPEAAPEPAPASSPETPVRETSRERSPNDISSDEFWNLNEHPELALEDISDGAKSQIMDELNRAQGMIRDMSTVAADQTRSEADRKDAAKVRNRYSSYAKSLRAIIGGNEGTELFGANRKIAQNAAEWIKAVREAQVDARNEDGTVRTDENGRRIKVRNGIDNTAYKRAVDAANFLGSCLGFRIRDFDTGERGAEPTYVWTGVHDRPSLTFQDVETFRRHRAELQSSNGNQGAPAAATPTSAPPPATETSTPPSAAEPASPPPPPPAPQAAPAAEPTASAPTSAPAPTPPAQPSAPAHRNFGAVANAAQRLGGQASSALARGILDRIRQRAERRRNNS